MTEKEVVKALRCISTVCRATDRDCLKCGYFRKWFGCDVDRLSTDAADLIERLTAENAKADAEREALLGELRKSGCTYCKYETVCEDNPWLFIRKVCDHCGKRESCVCQTCTGDGSETGKWQWRGLQEAPEEIKAPFTEDTMINLAAQALGVEPSRLRELAEADKDGRCVVLPPEERTLDFPAKYTEIRALYHFCVDLGIKCTIEHLYDGYAVRFPDGSDFAQHHGTYGGTEGCVEPAIGDSEFDYTAVGLNLAKELVKKHKGKLEANHA